MRINGPLPCLDFVLLCVALCGTFHYGESAAHADHGRRRVTSPSADWFAVVTGQKCEGSISGDADGDGSLHILFGARCINTYFSFRCITVRATFLIIHFDMTFHLAAVFVVRFQIC